jgi:small subunit ribosomal protein S9
MLNKNQPLDSRSNMKWASMSKITGTWGVKVSVDEQKQLTQKLGQLARIEGLAKDEKLTDFLDRFRMENHALVNQESNTTLDEWGRAYAVGYRRRVKAHVWLSKALVEGEGKMLIEGEEMTDYFPRFSDRAQVCLPFEVTGSIGSYNIWCKLESSVPGAFGHTAVSGAIANGVANALLVFKNHTGYLNAVKLLKPDLRQRERKKPGQPSSRSKFQWVKR